VISILAGMSEDEKIRAFEDWIEGGDRVAGHRGDSYHADKGFGRFDVGSTCSGSLILQIYCIVSTTVAGSHLPRKCSSEKLLRMTL
jgi:hypothetical protein